MVVTQSQARDRLLNSIIDHTDRAKLDLEVVALSDEPGVLAQDTAARGVHFASLGMRRVSLPNVPLAAFRLASVLRKRRPDLVHSVLFYASLAVELARISVHRPPPSVLARHHNLTSYLFGRRLHVELGAWSARRATHVIAVSPAVACTLVAERVPLDRISVISNSPDWAQTFATPEGKAGWRARFAGKTLAVAVGRLDPQKDYSTMLRAFAQVARLDPRVQLAIAGVGGEAVATQLRREAMELGIEGQVDWLGWVENPFDLVAAADVFVQTSVDESYGQALAEAVSLGVPVVATTPAAISDMIGAWYPAISPRDVSAVSLALRTTLEDRPNALVRAKTASAAIRTRYRPDAMAGEYEIAYRDIISTARSRSS